MYACPDCGDPLDLGSIYAYWCPRCATGWDSWPAPDPWLVAGGDR